MVRWAVGSILHGEPNQPFHVPTVCHDWCNKGHVLSEMVHIKDPFLLIKQSSSCSGSSGFPVSVSE